jgi:hypothetical protein
MHFQDEEQNPVTFIRMNIRRNFEYEKGSRYPILQTWYKNFSQKTDPTRFRGNNKIQSRTRIYLPSYELKNPKNKEKHL